jgi:hypothetical protein
VNHFLALILSLLVFSTVSLAQAQVDSGAPPPVAQDTIVPKKTVVRHKPVIDTTVKAITAAPDTTIKKDTATGAGTDLVTNDSTRPKAPVLIEFRITGGRPGYRGVLRLHPYYNFFANPVVRFSEERHYQGKETLFYLLMGMLFCLALIKVVFARYVNNLLALVFRVSLKQKQIREQLQQTPLPSLLLNIFFVIVAGLYVVFLRQHYHWGVDYDDFWFPFLYCSLAIGAVYIVKFIILKFTGWVFNMREAANTYAFIVFLVNKLLGMFLLPLLILMAFSKPSWAMPLLTLSYVLVFCFFAYRYIVSFGPVRREVKVSPFHFFMYLCAFEIAPLLLIYKVLLSNL